MSAVISVDHMFPTRRVTLRCEQLGERKAPRRSASVSLCTRRPPSRSLFARFLSDEVKSLIFKAILTTVGPLHCVLQSNTYAQRRTKHRVVTDKKAPPHQSVAASLAATPPKTHKLSQQKLQIHSIIHQSLHHHRHSYTFLYLIFPLAKVREFKR